MYKCPYLYPTRVLFVACEYELQFFGFYRTSTVSSASAFDSVSVFVGGCVECILNAFFPSHSHFKQASRHSSC